MDPYTDHRLRRYLSDRQGGMNRVIEERFRQFLDELSTQNSYAIGYPMAKDFNYAFLSNFLDLPLNNLGDPFVDGHYGINTKVFEREVIDFYARHFRAPDDDYWGYVTTGGTEGNLFSLSLARELYPDAIVLFSAATHYSVPKSCRLLRVEQRVVAAQASGEIDYDDLAQQLQTLRSRPIVIVANIGTTMTEAKDDVTRLRTVLRETGIERHFIHADAAFCGPFLHFSNYTGGFDLGHGADSITFSGHKFIGAPMPCGLVLTRKSLSERARQDVPYIGGADSTLGGSRNALAVMCLWFAIHQLGVNGFETRFRDAEAKARFLQAALCDLGIRAWRNPQALTVVFPPLPVELQSKWHLAVDHQHAHVVVMPNTPMTILDEFVNDVQGFARSR